MPRLLHAYASHASAFALLLLVGYADASRASDKHDAMKAISHHSLLKTTKTDSSAKSFVASLAIATKATKADSSAKAFAASTAVGAKASKTDFSALASIAIGTKATLKKTASKAIRELPEPVTDDAAEQTPKALCSVADDLQPDVALKEIEHCVKQLEMIKEGTLEQGRTSWEHNNKYVKSLAGLENRMTELSRPEPFEIAFAVDQADMYEKLKNRLQAIQLDLPKLQGLPGSLPERHDALAKQDMSEVQDTPAVEHGPPEPPAQDMSEEQDMPEVEDGPPESPAQDKPERDMPEVEDGLPEPSAQDKPQEQDMSDAEGGA